MLSKLYPRWLLKSAEDWIAFYRGGATSSSPRTTEAGESTLEQHVNPPDPMSPRLPSAPPTSSSGPSGSQNSLSDSNSEAPTPAEPPTIRNPSTSRSPFFAPCDIPPPTATVVGGDAQAHTSSSSVVIEPPIDSFASSASMRPAADAVSMSFLEGAKDFVIKDSILTNIRGDATILKIHSDAPLNAEFKTFFTKHLAGFVTVRDLDKVTKHALSQAIRDLPRVDTAYNDYASGDKRRVTCFEGTRQGILEEIATRVIASHGPEVYVLSGLAGIGKSTIAQTVAARADNLRSLGASFFFSRDEIDRRSAKKLFTTIAFQLCVYDEQFAQAIGTILLTEQGSAAASKEPQEQLEVLILEPLRDIVKLRQRPVVIVIDALDECDDDDAPIVLVVLGRLVRELPTFKIVLTARPQPHFQHLFNNPDTHEIFYLQNIADEVVDGDIRMYLKHDLSWDQVMTRLPALRTQWNADDEEIEYLVRAAGRLFIIASTTVRFLMDPIVYNPRSQMEALKNDDRVSLDGLARIYITVLRRAVPSKCKPDILQRFKVVIGTILAVQEPLLIKVLEHLTHPWNADSIDAVLINLQPVIILDNDTPRTYHNSVFDFLTNSEQCTEDLRIDLRVHHTQIAACCLQIMNKKLKRNILDICEPACFGNNAAQGVPEDQLHAKIPAELRYACKYWSNHIEGADTEDANIMAEMEKFASQHLLHYFEALSWLGKLDVAHHALRSVLKHLKLSPDMREVIFDAFRLVSRFYEPMKQSALHTYHSTFPFTPTQCPLYKGYCKEKTYNACWLGSGPTQWDPLIAAIIHPTKNSTIGLRFSQNSSLLASWTPADTKADMKFWDAMSGTPVPAPSLKGDGIVLTDDLSIAALPRGTTVTLFSVATNTSIATLTHSTTVRQLALSSDGCRLAAVLVDNTISLWDVRKGKHVHVAVLGSSSPSSIVRVAFSPRGYILASASHDGNILLWNGGDGKFVARLGSESDADVEFAFSRDGSRLASLTSQNGVRRLTVWSGEGIFIDAVGNVGGIHQLTISDDGSFLAAVKGSTVELRSGNSFLPIVGTLPIYPGTGIDVRLAFSHGLLAIANLDNVKLYDLTSRTTVSKLQLNMPVALAFSPDGARLAAGNMGGKVFLWDIASIKTPNPASGIKGRGVTSLAFSPDYSRLASGFGDGTVELWSTDQAGQPIASHSAHSREVTALAFSPDGEKLASGSEEKTLKVRNGKDGFPGSIAERTFPDELRSVAFSSGLLAVATSRSITICDRETLHLIYAIDLGGISVPFAGATVSFSPSGSLLAVACRGSYPSASNVVVWGVGERTKIAAFKVNSAIGELIFSPDGSRIFAETQRGSCKLFDVSSKKAIQQTGYEDMGWVPRFNGIQLWREWDIAYGDRLVGRFPGQEDGVTMLYFPRDVGTRRFSVGSSMFAVGCEDGRILLVRSSTAGFN